MARFSVALAAFIAFGVVPCGVSASHAGDGGHASAMSQLADDATPKKDAAAPATGRSGGTIDGVVTAIDYRSNTMSVSAGARKVDVMILPSTNIQGPNNGFRTIADIEKGSHVRVLLSQRAGLYSAQIITLR